MNLKEKSISELENALTMIGAEVEKIDNKFDYLDTVITAKIVDLKMHEDSNHLTVCSVDTKAMKFYKLYVEQKIIN